jgi:hypothetical protein
MDLADSYLLSLPLHAITEVYGEEGLRRRFQAEIAKFPVADRETLERALVLASDLHRDDRRVREPYLNHLLRTTIRIICYYHVTDVDVLTAAMLHDSVEDHPEELADGRPGDAVRAAALALAEQFNPRVAELVAAVTNPVYAPDRDRNEQYREHVADSLDGNPWARVIKVSDFTDNGVGVIHTTGPKVPKLAAKYLPLVPVLRDLVARPDTPLAHSVKQHILGQLNLAETRFRAILATVQA